MILRPLFCFKDTKNTGLLIFNSLKQKKLIFNFVVNRSRKKLTDSRKRAKILADDRKSHHPIETLFARSTQAKRHRSGRIFYLCTPFRGNVQILYRLQFCLHLKNFTVPRVACKEKADPCTFLAVQKFVKGV